MSDPGANPQPKKRGRPPKHQNLQFTSTESATQADRTAPEDTQHREQAQGQAQVDVRVKKSRKGASNSAQPASQTFEDPLQGNEGKYRALLEAASWVHTPLIRIHNIEAQLLGGHYAELSAILTNCKCSACKAESSCGRLFSLEELFVHSGLGYHYNLNSVMVLQGNCPPVSMAMVMAAWACACMHACGMPARAGQSPAWCMG